MSNKFLAFALLLPGVTFSQSPDQDRYRAEIRPFFNFGKQADNFTQSSSDLGGGLEASFDLNRRLALTGSYALTRIGRGQCLSLFAGGDYPCGPIENEKLREFMGGVRLSFPGQGGIGIPYITGTLGEAKLDRTLVATGSERSTEFAYGIGVGFELRPTRRFGFAFEARAVEAVSSKEWFICLSPGFSFRF
jgi:hypothetical protein